MNPTLTFVSGRRPACRGWAFVLLLAATSAVHADCADGSRASTAEEKAYVDKLAAALKAAVVEQAKDAVNKLRGLLGR